MNLSGSFEKYLQSQIEAYYPDLNSEEVRVVFNKETLRLASRFYYYTVRNGSTEKNIFVKISVPQEELMEKINRLDENKKPRLYPRTNPVEMSDLEANALSSIYKHFEGVRENGVSAIRVLDYLPDKHAIVMEEMQSSSLRSLVGTIKFVNWKKRDRNFEDIFKRSGFWLRHFHAMPLKENVPLRLATRSEYILAVEKLCDYLKDFAPYQHEFDLISEKSTLFANDILSEDLPVGLSHADFAPRNILVAPDGAVTAIDTFAKWRATIYEDIGYFINGLYTVREQALSLGLAYSKKKLLKLENAFLAGYFGKKPPPYGSVKLFELLALLDKWASVTEDEQPKLLKKIIGRFTYHRYFRQRAKAILEEIKRGKDER